MSLHRLVILAVLVLLLMAAAYVVLRPDSTSVAGQFMRLRAWLASPGTHPDWAIAAGARCGDAPMLLPTNGYIGFGWDDSFRPGHRHSGFDIFGPDRKNGVTPVVAAYDGYVTRESDWKSAVIIRHPDFPEIVPGEQIWTFYTHMASGDGETSYIASEFPAGTHEVFVKAGTLLGHQGNWSGTPNVPTGRHLHFSIVKSTSSGGYANETEIANTYDPTPFLGISRNRAGVLVCISE